MSDISPALQAKSSIFRNAYGLVSSRLLAGLLAIEQDLAGRREQAMLRNLDPGVLQDIGIEPAPAVEIEPNHASRGRFAALCEVFSWTRFAK